MALNIDTQDLVNYPGTVKRVTVDHEQLVPAGFEGDEQFVISVTTTAYSDNTNRTAIQDLYVTDYKTGWCKSSGFAGVAGKFYLDSDHYMLKVKVDATVSGTDGSGYYTISLDYNADGTPLTGDVVAADIEDKIRAISLETADSGFALSYNNVSVEFQDGKFWIASGSIGSYYTGSNRSSVRVLPASTKDCSTELGFDIPMYTEALDGIAVKETYLTSNYTTNTTPMAIAAGTSVAAGDCLMITDGTNTDYFTALAGTTNTSVIVPVSGTNGFIGVANSYTVSGTKLQVLREQDPDADPQSWLGSIDELTRHGVKTIINQIDYSS